MFEIGRLCVKLAGRDAGKKCVIVEILEKNFVLIDGETRRRKCNINHLEPLEQKIEIKKEATHEDVIKAFEKIGLTARNTKPKKAEPRKKKVKLPKTKILTKKKKAEKPAEKPKETSLEKATEKAENKTTKTNTSEPKKPAKITKKTEKKE